MKALFPRLLLLVALMALGVGASPSLAVGGSEAASAPRAAPVSLPLYATRVPPSVRESYTLRRGLMTGRGDFVWRVDAGRYEARLEGTVAGVTVLDWISRGLFDEAGIAPQRFVVRRIGRGEQAATFQRAAGKITFSPSGPEQPLVPGTQDRLSWMVQLPAIVAARPERFAAGEQVVLHVAGARGDLHLWTLEVVGRERVAGANGNVDALKLVRQPKRGDDARVEIWLDPQRHYLPVRAHMGGSGREPAFELLREGH